MENRSDVSAIMQDQAIAGFSDRPVSRALIEEMLDVARRAPSGTNTQPWNVVVLQGEALAGLVDAATGALPGIVGNADSQQQFWDRWASYPGKSGWPEASQHAVLDAPLARAMAQTAGGDAGSELARYFRFFGAPVALMFTVHRILGLGSVLDYGMFLQNITLAARARGLQTCVQTGWKGLCDTALAGLGMAGDELLVCGMALGYPDAGQPPVQAQEEWPALESYVTWHA